VSEAVNDSRIIKVLEEILMWTKVGMYPTVERMLQSQFKSARPEERLAFELLDGTRSQKDVVAISKKSIPEAKISPAALSAWVAKWEKLGLVRKNGNMVTRLFSLRDFGIDVPQAIELATESR
jgi:hypothetical protein